MTTRDPTPMPPPLAGMQQIRASEFKKNQADTYSAADNAPVALIKGIGMSQPVITHVLMAVEDYLALATAPVEASVPWQEREIEDDGKNGYRYVEPHRRPVEASGSERERIAAAIDPRIAGMDFCNYTPGSWMGQALAAADRVLALRPQPSGETRTLLERIAAVRARKDFTPQQANAGLLTVLDDCAAALSTTPARALGGQQGSGEESQ